MWSEVDMNTLCKTICLKSKSFITKSIHIATFLGSAAGCLLTPTAAHADIYTVFSDTAERGTVVWDGTSLGAFTINGGYVSFANAQTTGNYDSVMSFDSTYFDPTLPASATPVYLDYTGFNYPTDVELAIAPVSISMWLPSTITSTVGDPGGAYQADNTLAPPGATLINFTGLPTGGVQSAAFEITYLGDALKFNGGMSALDPTTGATVDLTISGEITAATDSAPESLSTSFVIRETEDVCTYTAGELLITGKSSSTSGGTDTDSDVAPVSLPICTVPEPPGWTAMLAGFVTLSVAGAGQRLSKVRR